MILPLNQLKQRLFRAADILGGRVHITLLLNQAQAQFTTPE